MAKQFTIEELREAKAAIDQLMGTKHDPASTVSTWAQPHGLGGLLSQSGARPNMFSTIVRPTNTFMSAIPLRPSNKLNEVFEILTGQTATAGSRAADVCSEGPLAGRLKVMRQVIPFGTMKLDTEIDRIPDIGLRRDYADVDRTFENIETLDSPFIPDVVNQGNNINTVAGKKMYETGLAIERSVEFADIVGVAGGTSADPDLIPFISQYAGLEAMVRTGLTDSISGVAAPAADSVVVTHNASIDSNGTNGAGFVTNVVDAVYAVREIARQVGMGDVVHAIVMNPKMFRAVAYKWACEYYTTACTGTTANPNFQNATEVVAARDEMLRNRVLMVDGEPIPVLLSTGIPTPGVSNNVFNSDLFVVPMQWRGAPLIYRQYFPLNNGDISQLGDILGPAAPRVMNNGLYLMGHRTTNGFCTKLEFVSRMRLILDAPFLAARVNDVQFTYRAQTRDVRVGESLYRNGGVSSRV